MTNGASRSITAKAAANIWSAERASIDNVNVEKGSGSKGLELPNSGELAVCIYFARRRSDRMRERSLRVSAQPYPNRYPRCRSAVMTRFTIIAIVRPDHDDGARTGGSFPITDQTVKCITAGRPTLAMHRPACRPTSLPPNARAVRCVSATLRRPLRLHHSNRFLPEPLPPMTPAPMTPIQSEPNPR